MTPRTAPPTEAAGQLVPADPSAIPIRNRAALICGIGLAVATLVALLLAAIVATFG